MKYDVIIVGASFAGLAVASRIKTGRVLLLDPKPIGQGIKSACGTILKVVGEMGLENAVKQIHKKIVLHLSQGDLFYPLYSPFCVVDGQSFCRQLFAKGKAEFLQARVIGISDSLVKTDRGQFQTRIFVDASGPQSIKHHLSFGIETILPYQEESLHFWYEPKNFPKGVFWLFPQGRTSRFGVGSYQGKTNLKPYLNEFLARFGLKAGKLHGGWFPHRLRKPAERKIFRVGDVAGQCLPVTGEGIRPAIFFGQKCGEIIEEILLNKINLDQGFSQYQDFVLQRRYPYEALYWAQQFLISIPEVLFYPLAWLVSKKPFTSFVLNNYLGVL